MFIHGWLLEQFSGSQAAFGITLKVTGGYQASCRVLQEEFSSDFIEKSRNFNLDVLHKKTVKNCKKHQHAYNKVIFYFTGLQKRCISWHYPFECSALLPIPRPYSCVTYKHRNNILKV
jgi:hypothetical protein